MKSHKNCALATAYLTTCLYNVFVVVDDGTHRFRRRYCMQLYQVFTTVVDEAPWQTVYLMSVILLSASTMFPAVCQAVHYRCISFASFSQSWALNISSLPAELNLCRFLV